MSHTQLPTGDPATLGFDPERLARIGPAMQAFVDNKRVPNLITLVARRGQIVHHEATGVLDFDGGVAAPLDTLNRMYSNTKPIAGVATLILFERGVLTPDDPVSKWLPEFAKLRVQQSDQPMMTEPAKRRITIRDCLTNTTGLMSPALMPNFYRQQYGDVLRDLGWITDGDEERATLSNRERVARLAELPLAAHPGERFGYHIGYPILSAVLEAASGKPLDEFFRTEIFRPLGMQNTDFYLEDLPADAASRFGACYVPRKVDGHTVLAVAESAATSPKAVGPKSEFAAGGDAGGVLSTASDYARFGQMLLNGGELDGVRIIGRKTRDLMVGNHTGDLPIPMTGPGFHWGLGVATYHGRDRFPLIRSVGTYGWGGAAGTTYFADPSEELLGVCLTQVLQASMMPNNNYQEEFQRLVYQALV